MGAKQLLTQHGHECRPSDAEVAASKTMEQQETTPQASGSDAERHGQADDPNVPVGNAPPGPTWPLVVSGLAWVGWVVFLFVMVLSTRAHSAT